MVKKDINLGCDQRFLSGVKAPGTICNSHNKSYFVLYCHRRRTHSTLVFMKVKEILKMKQFTLILSVIVIFFTPKSDDIQKQTVNI